MLLNLLSGLLLSFGMKPLPVGFVSVFLSSPEITSFQLDSNVFARHVCRDLLLLLLLLLQLSSARPLPPRHSSQSAQRNLITLCCYVERR